MDYQQALDILNSTASNSLNLGLERLIRLLEKMGNPQDKLKFIHVAGTNGKGSIVKMLSNILTYSGYRAGLYISPFVLDFREQFQIDGAMIEPEEFASCASFVFGLIDFDDANRPTQYEIQTAIAFEWFHRRGCDLVCLEVGLGGQDDATNVIQTAILHIIASISLDHQDILGHTIYEIAVKKAGIIKSGPTVLYPLQEKMAIDVITKKCTSEKNELVIPDPTKLVIEDKDGFGNDFVYDGDNYHTSLNGKVQIYNSLTVIEAAKKLSELGYMITPENIKKGIANTWFPARMEVISQKPLVILDGSHNPAGAKALSEFLAGFKGRKITLVMGVLKDKDYHEILELLCPLAGRLFAVAPANFRALPAVELALVAQNYCDKVYSFEDVERAAATALQVKDDEVVVVCGSLYLAMDSREILLKLIAKGSGPE